jgi:hypothetical protein
MSDTCPVCTATMEEIDGSLWTIDELTADLARMSADENDEKILVINRRCPRGCHQCFGCRSWFSARQHCAQCPRCPECGGPMVPIAEDEEDGATPVIDFGCIRCENAVERVTKPAGFDPAILKGRIVHSPSYDAPSGLGEWDDDIPF